MNLLDRLSSCVLSEPSRTENSDAHFFDFFVQYEVILSPLLLQCIPILDSSVPHDMLTCRLPGPDPAEEAERHIPTLCVPNWKMHGLFLIELWGNYDTCRHHAYWSLQWQITMWRWATLHERPKVMAKFVLYRAIFRQRIGTVVTSQDLCGTSHDALGRSLRWAAEGW